MRSRWCRTPARSATTTCGCRWPPAPRRSASSTTSWCRGGAATPSSTTAGSSPSPRWPGSGSRSRRSSTPSHAEIGRWFDVGLVDGLRVDHPDGLRDPGDYLDRLAALTGGRRTSWSRRSSSPARSCRRRGRAPGPPATTPSALVDRVLIDPAGEPLLDRLAGSVDFAALDPRHQARGRRRLAPGRGAPDRPGAAAGPAGAAPRRGGRAAGLLPGLPLLPAATGVEHLEEASLVARGPAVPTWCPRYRRAGAGARRPGSAGGAAVPADQRDGDGQGGRGLRVLPLLAAHLAQRGRRRPVGLRADGRRVPRRDGAAPGRVAGRDDRARRPTTPSAARTSGPASPSWPRHPSCGRARSGTLLDAAPLPDAGLRQPALAGGVRRVADLARAAARLRREGDARGRRPDHLDRPRRGVRTRRARGRRRGVRRRAGAGRPRAPSTRSSRSRPRPTRSPPSC